MILTLPNPPGRLLLLLCGVILAASLGYLTVRNALAAHARGLDTRAGYLDAVRLEPADSRNWYLLGRSYLYDLEQPDAERAIDALRKAVSLDRYSAEALLDLANAYDGEGAKATAREAYVAAERAYPLSADVCWSYGNFLLRQGEQDAAFAQIHKTLELEPKRGAEAFSLAIRVQPDPTVVLDKAIPASAAAYLPIVQALSSAGEVDTAQQVWKRLIALQPKVPIRELVGYVDAVGQKKGPSAYAQAWREAISIMQNPPPPDPRDSLVWDGGFESGYDGGGFAWHYNRDSRKVHISFDSAEKHSGGKSMRVLFDGRENLNFEDLCHNIAPQAGQRYLLTAWVKTQSLTSSEGVRLQISVFAGAQGQSVTTDEVHGTQDWKQIQLSWTAPPDADFATVCMKRLMSDQADSNIQGAAWLDDVTLAPLDPAALKP
jgi:hypothetical protein